MSMSQLVLGSAVGFFLAQGALFVIKRFLDWLQRDTVRQRIRELTPARGSGFVSAFVRHAGLIGASAALITLGVWAVRDYLAANSARSTELASTLDPAAALSLSDSQMTREDTAGPAPAAAPSTAPEDQRTDPYRDPDFVVRRKTHRAGAAASLKDTLLQRSEAKARAELLSETRQHARRSQYDCEAAEHVSRYLKGGLDVWGFASWQVKYFPVQDYKGATLAQCQDIENVVDPSALDLKSTVAQQKTTPNKSKVPGL